MHFHLEFSLHGDNIGAKDYINGKNSAMWFGYDIPVNLTCEKLSNLSEFLPKDIEVMYFNRDGLVLGRKYGA